MLIDQRKLELLRQTIAQDQIDGFLVPHADEYLSEYTPACAERLAWMTGFTGSSGMAVILQDKALALTDSRYTIQIKTQVDSALYELADMAQLTASDWIKAHSTAGTIIGYDPQLHTQKQIDDMITKLEGTGIIMQPVLRNPIDRIWQDRPSEPNGIAELFPEKIAGFTSREKRQIISQELLSDKIDAVVLTASDSICWLLNIRGDDVAFNPVILSRAVLHTVDSSIDWFVEEQKIPLNVREALGESVRIHNPSAWFTFLSGLKGAVQFDPQRSPYAVKVALEKGASQQIARKDPCIIPKACKTMSEQISLRQAHIRDGVALTRFLYWLDCQKLDHGHITELAVEERLEEFRRSDATYRGPSFSTIAGWKEHGAIIHYRATPESNQKITGNGLLLLDSGGQYEYGTTDITRTIVLGRISDVMREHFTRCLKGHIAVSSAQFDETATGADIDALARQSLRDIGIEFGHSTGHGVGCYLCVHEEASALSPRSQEPLKPGMLLSNEPGCYIEGQYGIRHENLMICEDRGDGQLGFDPVTLVPFDLRGIEWDLITPAERMWLTTYHQHVFDMLVPFLDDTEIDWLRTFLID